MPGYICRVENEDGEPAASRVVQGQLWIYNY